ncbi:MAG: ATP-binding protein, partial [Thermodesulfovibrionales bacterium]
ENNVSKEAINLEKINNVTYLRYTSALYVEKPCLSCHGKQGYKIGDVRGAISVMIPIEKTLSEIDRNKKTMVVLALLTVFSVMSILFIVIQKNVLKPMKHLKDSINDFSEGRYSDKNKIITGDEFEDICKSFSEMAKKISEHNSELSDKIRESTKELEEINQKLTQYNQILDESNKKKSDFIASISHELRTPLTTIKGSMDFITARLKNLDTTCQNISDLEEFCELIKKNCERLIRMVNTMLDIERLESGVIETNMRPIDIRRIIYETVISLRPQAEEKEIRFNIDTTISSYVIADEDMIRQVLTNIIINAIKFTPKGSCIDIKTGIDSQYLYTYINDNGEGIDEYESSRIFEKFYKGKGKKDGSGLGLAICKSIIKLHDGIIGVKAREDAKKGSCFYFALKIDDGSQKNTYY